MELEFTSYTAWLVEEVQSFAEAPARDAELFPEDPRILRRSKALRTLADNLKELPADHPKIQELWRLWLGPGVRPLRPRKTTSLDLIRIVTDELQKYGYHCVDVGDPVSFLDSLLLQLESNLDSGFAESE